MKNDKAREFSLKDDRGFIPFLLLLLILYLILKYSYNFDVITSVQTNGLPYTVGHFFTIMWSWWTDNIKPFIVQTLSQVSQTVTPPPTH
jgi:hypothetical protein